MRKVEKEFEQINSIIERRWERAIGLANAEALMSYWSVGAFVSARLKSSSWGAKTVEALSDYLKTRNPRRRGFGKRQIYNMVAFYEAYTSVDFQKISDRLRLYEFVQLPTAQLGDEKIAGGILCIYETRGTRKGTTRQDKASANGGMTCP